MDDVVVVSAVLAWVRVVVVVHRDAQMLASAVLCRAGAWRVCCTTVFMHIWHMLLFYTHTRARGVVRARACGSRRCQQACQLFRSMLAQRSVRIYSIICVEKNHQTRASTAARPHALN